MVWLVDEGVGERVVVEARRRMAHAELRFVNLLGRCRIDGPVEAEDVACAVGLQALGFGRAASVMGSAELLAKENKQRDGPLSGAEDGPVGRAGALEAGVDDIFRAVRFVGLRNEAAAAGERSWTAGGKSGNEFTGRWRMR